MGRLTTHVLNTATGKPADHVPIFLFYISLDGTRSLVAEATTNQDGRTESPLMGPEEFRAGTYELVFQVKDYFGRSSLPQSSPPFFDTITLRVTLADDREHYHVPLLVSPWAYATYRGS